MVGCGGPTVEVSVGVEVAVDCTNPSSDARESAPSTRRLEVRAVSNPTDNCRKKFIE
jgi:hypothetical protein